MTDWADVYGIDRLEWMWHDVNQALSSAAKDVFVKKSSPISAKKPWIRDETLELIFARAVCLGDIKRLKRQIHLI